METTKTMKRKSLLAILVCCFALCVAMALAGCGDSKADYSKNFTGDWEISSMVDAEEDIDADTLDFMKAMGLNCTLTLKEDKTASIDLFGEVSEGTWEPKSASECSVTLEGNSMNGKLDGEKLTFTDDASTLVFVKAAKQSSHQTAIRFLFGFLCEQI